MPEERKQQMFPWAKDTERLIVCMREGPGTPVMMGDTRHKCARCGHWVIVSADSLLLSIDLKATIYCKECAIARSKALGIPYQVRPSRATMEEVFNHLGLGKYFKEEENEK